MFEFMVPEPAAFHIHGKAVKTSEGENMVIPEKPTVNCFGEIIERNYGVLAAKYDAQDITPPPQPNIYIGKSFNQTSVSGVEYYTASEAIEIPDGYEAFAVQICAMISAGTGTYFHIIVGNFILEGGDLVDFSYHFPSPIEKSVPVAIKVHSDEYAYTITINCKLKTEGFTA